MVAAINETGEVFIKRKLARMEELKAARATREPDLQAVCDYIFPRRDFTITRQPQDVRTRKLMDVTGMIAHERLSATLFGYMLSPYTPWTRPTLLGRDASPEEDVWFDHVSRRMHIWFSASSNTFRVSMAEDVLDSTGLGTSVLWQDRTPKGSKYIALPLRQNFWAENEEGVIDTNYRVYQMTLARAAERWPDSPGLREKMGNTNTPESEMVDILHLVEPREGGELGRVRDRLPWRDMNILIDKMEALDVGGHSRFKYNIGRFKKRAGDPLGYGAAHTAVPFCKLASAMMEAIIRNAEKRADPTLGSFLPRSTVIDRRPGQVNFFNQLMTMGMRDPTQMLFEIERGGDVGIAVDMLAHIHSKIEQSFYVDWLTPNEGPQKTATEVYDLRDIRLRTMGPIVARMEHEKLNRIAEDTFEDLQAINFFDPPPASLNDELIGFEFYGPLANAQRQGEFEGIQKTIAAGEALAKVDPDVTMLFSGERTMRRIADLNGMDGGLLASPKEFIERRQTQREVGEMQQEMAAVQAAATSLRDGGQGVASLTQAGAGQAV